VSSTSLMWATSWSDVCGDISIPESSPGPSRPGSTHRAASNVAAPHRRTPRRGGCQSGWGPSGGTGAHSFPWVQPAVGHRSDVTPSDTLAGIWISTLSDTQEID
jgi:hypothetical protein